MTTQNIPVVFAADDNYVPYMGVAIQSIIENANPKNRYEIFILTRGFSEIYTQTLASMQTSNVKIEQIDITKHFTESVTKDLHISGHVTTAAYFRLLIPQIFRKYDKIIYLDCDLVLTRDIAELFNTDVSNYYMAAIRDIGLVATSEKYPDTEYFCGTLGLPSVTEYFNSGVLVYNLSEMRKDHIDCDAITTMRTLTTPRFHDQCILNKICKGHVKYLDMNWNYWGNFKYDCPDYKNYFPEKYISEFNAASENPYCIHYKPWLNPYVEYAYVFWNYARKSPFYEIILFENIIKKAEHVINDKLMVKCKTRRVFAWHRKK